MSTTQIPLQPEVLQKHRPPLEPFRRVHLPFRCEDLVRVGVQSLRAPGRWSGRGTQFGMRTALGSSGVRRSSPLHPYKHYIVCQMPLRALLVVFLFKPPSIQSRPSFRGRGTQLGMRTALGASGVSRNLPCPPLRRLGPRHAAGPGALGAPGLSRRGARRGRRRARSFMVQREKRALFVRMRQAPGR